MRTRLDCYPCLARLAAASSQLATGDPRRREEAVRRALQAVGAADPALAPPPAWGPW